MAERRMFAKTIIDSDAFLDMPQSSQLLYFHLSMRADDEGFINNPRAIMRNIGCKEDDAKLLIAKKFIIPFESGVVVIKHWKIHNYIAKDRFTPTKYQEERKQLELDENKSYTTCIQPVHKMDTQVRIGKDSIGKDSIGKDSIGEEKKKETFVSVVDGYTSSLPLKTELNHFVEMRKKKKGFTIHALKLALNKLDKLATDDNMKVAIVKESILNGWNSFFPLKNIGIVQVFEEVEPTGKEEAIADLKDEYETLLEMKNYGCDVDERIKNVQLMYKDLTGEEL